MGRNIKNAESCRLASELAYLTRETKTGAIEERLERERRQRSVDARLRKMRVGAERCAKLLRAGGPPVDHSTLLYDERGLPK